MLVTYRASKRAALGADPYPLPLYPPEVLSLCTAIPCQAPSDRGPSNSIHLEQAATRSHVQQHRVGLSRPGGEDISRVAGGLGRLQAATLAGSRLQHQWLSHLHFVVRAGSRASALCRGSSVAASARQGMRTTATPALTVMLPDVALPDGVRFSISMRRMRGAADRHSNDGGMCARIWRAAGSAASRTGRTAPLGCGPAQSRPAAGHPWPRRPPLVHLAFWMVADAGVHTPVLG